MCFAPPRSALGETTPTHRVLPPETTTTSPSTSTTTGTPTPTGAWQDTNNDGVGDTWIKLCQPHEWGQRQFPDCVEADRHRVTCAPNGKFFAGPIQKCRGGGSDVSVSGGLLVVAPGQAPTTVPDSANFAEVCINNTSCQRIRVDWFHNVQAGWVSYDENSNGQSTADLWSNFTFRTFGYIGGKNAEVDKSYNNCNIVHKAEDMHHDCYNYREDMHINLLPGEEQCRYQRIDVENDTAGSPNETSIRVKNIISYIRYEARTCEAFI